MKKLTAGIFTVLLGVVAANSADAALTSKAYVDAQVGAKVSTTDFNQFKTENNAAVAKKADQTAMETALAGKQQKLNSTNFKKDGTGNVISGVTVDESGNVTFATSNVATTEGLDNLKTTVDEHTTALGTLNGTAETTGSVANKIATAISDEKTRADGAYDAKGAAGTAETNAKAYADGLAKNYATAEQGKTADATAAAVNNATTGLAATKAIADQNKTAIAAMDTAIATNTANIAKKQDTLTEAQLKAVNSGITEAKVTTYDSYGTKITAAQTQADKGVADAAAAQATANAAIPKPGTDCTTLGAKCVLVVGESGYAWESVERDAGEATGA